MKKCFVGFDTSNYTTSAAVCDEDGKIVANIKRPLPVKEGERGLRQSDAVFFHVRNLPVVTDELSYVLEGNYEPLAVGVSSKPRDVAESYMPCFLSGVAAAHSFSASCRVPILEFSHQSGHIMAAAYSSGYADRLLSEKFLAFHVSGGTTEALLISPMGSYFSSELVGATKDLNAGQAIDRIGVALGLKFPCGPELEKLAKCYFGDIPKKNISVKDGSCNLSGLESLAMNIYEQTGDKNLTAAFVFDFICRTLMKMSEQLMEKYGQMKVLFAGGVMSNTYMREKISNKFEAYFSEPEFSSDNAAGIALLCRKKYTDLFNK